MNELCLSRAFLSGQQKVYATENSFANYASQWITFDSLKGGFYKIGRTSEDISMVNAAATLIIDNNTITAAHLVLGAVAPTPLRVKIAEEALIGQSPTEEAFQQAAELVYTEVRPISDQRASAEYRQRMSKVAAMRALRQAAGLATIWRGMAPCLKLRSN